MTWPGTLWWLFAGYALLTGALVVLENRRPQATLAWMLLFLTLPGVGLVIYVLFGRDRKAAAFLWKASEILGARAGTPAPRSFAA